MSGTDHGTDSGVSAPPPVAGPAMAGPVASRRPAIVGEIAYLNTEYPSLSHTFIEREVRNVRSQGIRVRTYSIRRPGPTGRIGSANAEAARETTYLLDGTARLLASLAVAALAAPLGFLRAHVAAQRLAPGGLKARALHAAYAMEAVRLARLLRRDGPRHIHVHMANNGAMVALLACRYDRRLRYSLSIHGSAEFFDVFRLQLGAKAQGAAFVRCISNFCRAQVMAWSDPASWERMTVVPTGVDVRALRPIADRPQDRLRLLTVGRMVPIKGYDLLLDACSQLSSKGVDWSLDMVGDGPVKASLERRAAALGIAKRIVFSGPVAQDDMPKHLREANVMVMSSFMEGVPVVLMEAMATGMAVVATRVGGVAELVEDGRSGLLVDTGSADALAAALIRVAADVPLRTALGAAAREAVVARYDVDEAGRMMAGLFAKYVGTEAAR